MRAYRSRWQLMAVVVFVGACAPPSDLGAPLTVQQYLHDIDKTKTILAKVHANPSRYRGDRAYLNARYAYATSLYLNCWERGKPESTATADHQCIDAHAKVWLKN
jgi:hypothetical protein